MSVWSAIVVEAVADRTAYVAAAVGVGLLAAPFARGERRNLKAIVFFFIVHLIGVVVCGVLRQSGSPFHAEVRLPVLIAEALVAVDVATLLVFTVLLPRVQVHTPRILHDVAFVSIWVVAVLVIASQVGVNLSGVIATSAVVTAVIGFSLQDTLGNIIGGLALQMDSSIDVGDWVKVGDVVGRVSEIRWRYTALETRNWETAIIPNSVLMKNQVIVLGRREGQPVQLRRWVWFNVDFRSSPAEVIRVVLDALAHASIPGVAAEPTPTCVLMDLTESYGKYALRYWLTDLPKDDPTDSLVRTWIYFALKRAGIPLSIPAQALFVTEESADRRAEKGRHQVEQSAIALGRIDLFAKLSDAERAELAHGLHRAPFAKGEVITRQGAVAHYLYLVIDGEVSVSISGEHGAQIELARMGASNFFGEMSLMTGAPRSATVIAITDCQCYRLDKAAFEAVIRRRPEMADSLAAVLAKRQVGLFAARENLDHEEHARQVALHKVDILAKIRAFFGLEVLHSVG